MKATLVSLVALSLTLVTGNLMAIEEAEYRVSVIQDEFEIREYEPSIVAEVVVNDGFEDASNAAFRTLFKYISGKNTSSSKIAMTAPVTQESRSEKIDMTAPVGQRQSGQGWVVSFMMPASYTMDTIPTPADPSVVLREVPAHQVAAIRYSGRWSEKAYRKQLLKLQEWIKSTGLKATGEPLWARYNSPFTPWFMRRNEILIPVDS